MWVPHSAVDDNTRAEGCQEHLMLLLLLLDGCPAPPPATACVCAVSVAWWDGGLGSSRARGGSVLACILWALFLGSAAATQRALGSIRVCRNGWAAVWCVWQAGCGRLHSCVRVRA